MCTHLTHSGPSLAEWSLQGRQVKMLNLTDDGREWLWKTIEAQRAGFIGHTTQQVQRALNAQRDEVLRRVRNALSRAAVRNAVEDATNRLSDDFAESIRALYRRVWPIFARQAREATRGKSVRALWHLDRKQDGEEGLWRRQAEQYVDDEAGTLIQAPNETTKEGIRRATQNALQRAIEEGWGTERIAQEIDANTTTLVNQSRARRIARTEIIRGSNRASLAGARRTQSQVGINLRKEWIETMDDRTRLTHTASGVGGNVVPLNSKFSVGGFAAEYPSDPALPARESVNCRCTLAYITA